jgi:hypothetical protein
MSETHKMLHELLFALLGFTGDSIILTRDPIFQLPTFRVVDGFSKIPDAEIEQINQIAPLGWYYKQFQDYIKQYDMTWSSTNSSLSIYKMALAAALQDLLQEYDNDISDLENMLNSEPLLTLTTFAIHLKNYDVAFPYLYKLLRALEEQQLKGCQILDFFAKTSIGNPILTDLTER